MLWWGMYETTNESVVLYVRMEILACRIQNVMAGAQKKKHAERGDARRFSTNVPVATLSW